MPRHRSAFLVAVAGMLMSATAWAAEPPAATQPAVDPAKPGFALTIYSSADPGTFDPKAFAQLRKMYGYNPQYRLPGYGVVRETRAIDLNAGENVVRFTDVASGIDPTTVSFKSLTAPDTTSVLEQNYEYDLVSSDKLLEKYLSKGIVIVRKSDKIEGTLLSYDGATLVVQGKDKGVQIVPRNAEITSIQLAELSAGLITKPTLVWKIDAEKAGQHAAQVTYQTDSLTWRSDYTFVVNANDTALDIGAWVTIVNESGASYPDAKLKLVAGDVQRIQPEQQPVYKMGEESRFHRADVNLGFQEKSFFEYHLYTLGRTTTLGNNTTKQIELFPTRSDVPATKTFVYYGLPENMRYWQTSSPNQDRNLGTQSNTKVDVYLSFKNSEKIGMGVPLPAGRIRVYKRDDADAALEFIGEDLIQHTPKDEEVLVKLGSAFDIVGERKQTDFNANYDQHWITEAFEIKLRNHKKDAVTVLIKESLYRWSNWEITNSSDKWEKQDFRTIHIPVEIPPDGEKVVKYSVKYTW